MVALLIDCWPMTACLRISDVFTDDHFLSLRPLMRVLCTCICACNMQRAMLLLCTQAHDAGIRSLVYTHNENYVLSGDDAGLLRYWKPNLECLKSAQAHGEAIQGIACAPSDLKFVSCSDDSSIKVWHRAGMMRIDGCRYCAATACLWWCCRGC